MIISKITDYAKDDEHVRASIGYYELGRKNYDVAEKIFKDLIGKKALFTLLGELVRKLKGQRKI